MALTKEKIVEIIRDHVQSAGSHHMVGREDAADAILAELTGSLDHESYLDEPLGEAIVSFADAYDSALGNGFRPNGQAKHLEQVFVEAIASIIPRHIRELEVSPVSRDFSEAERILLRECVQTGFKSINDNADLYVCTKNAMWEFAQRVAIKARAQLGYDGGRMVEPAGWYLAWARHNHIQDSNGNHVPNGPAHLGAWEVRFVRHAPSIGGKILSLCGTGKDLHDAWIDAVRAVEWNNLYCLPEYRPDPNYVGAGRKADL
ncbi:hypothetical protein AEAC466_04440 [Asticcacaulis sp. AC466]|uniref:hypothetical protein n=1 Tax=Asticcacaulis sp. AC466 TaxID=1282362 RepID=UPI0003C3EFC5|nr:hypothetical protein [Asticcacaulis sp. AC466]ESQ85419.1 hypothetical protein AEAC466_04440 [Asticcacaulis sp. AC466]